SGSDRIAQCPGQTRISLHLVSTKVSLIRSLSLPVLTQPYMQKRIRITDLLYPHWKALSLAFIAVVGTSIADVLEPWPLKIVFDHVFGSKRLPDWLAPIVGYIGTDKISILNFAVLCVIAIAV